MRKITDKIIRDMLSFTILQAVCCVTICLTCFASGSGFYRRRTGETRPTLAPFGKPTPYAPRLYNLFIYGKLKKNEENHYWLTNPENGLSKFLGLGQTVQKYPLIVGKYKTPILIDSPGTGHKILGEMYLVDTFMLRNLDMLQGFPVFNSRKMDVIKIFSEEFPRGKETMCWMYFARVKAVNLSGLRLISEYSSKS